MPLKIGNTTVTKVNYNNTVIHKVIFNGTVVFEDDYVIPTFGGTAGRTVLQNNNNGWKIKLTSSGTLTTAKDVYVDVFVVGGGGGGANFYPANVKDTPGGGNGGCQATLTNKLMKAGTSYSITIGAGGQVGVETDGWRASHGGNGESSSISGTNISATAAGGYGGYCSAAGQPDSQTAYGSGRGGRGALYDWDEGYKVIEGTDGGTGGREFGTGEYYSSGGGGIQGNYWAQDKRANGAGTRGDGYGSGGSAKERGYKGCVIIRNHV